MSQMRNVGAKQQRHARDCLSNALDDCRQALSAFRLLVDGPTVPPMDPTTIYGVPGREGLYQNTASRLPKMLATLVPVFGSSGTTYE